MCDCIADMCEYIQSNRSNAAITREDMADACEQRCHYMLGKALSAPHNTSMSFTGWRVLPAEI